MKHKYSILMLVIGSFLLFACGITDPMLEGADQSNESFVEDNAPEEPLETQPPAEIELTAEPQETEQIGEESPAGGDLTIDLDQNSACYHPYFPISDGAYWTYQESFGEDYQLRVTETGQDSFTVTQEMFNEEAIFTADWFCSESGILSASFSQLDLLNQAADVEGSPEMVFETLVWEGETLPAAALMVPGYAWSTNYQMNAELNIESFMQTFEAHVTVEHEIGAIEEVAVPAGVFPEAVRVDSRGIIEMILAMGETTMPFSGFEFTYSTWYVENVGMVKSSDDFEGLKNSVELTESSLLN